MRLLRNLFARTHRKQAIALEIELLEARLVPSSQQQQLNHYWSDKLADINPPNLIQLPTIPLTPLQRSR